MPSCAIYLALLTALAMAGCAAARAQQPDAAGPLQEIEVTSSRLPLAWRRQTTSVSVLDHAAIQARGNLTLVDVLRQMPSVSASRNGGAGSVTNLRIRGEEGFRTLFLIDGLRLNDPSAVQVTTQPEHLLAAGIDRVELLRGPQGLAYGADAGGVVNISTAAPAQGLRLALDAQGGAYGTRRNVVRVAAGGERADLTLRAAQLYSRGFNQRVSDRERQDRDGYRNETVHVRLGVNAAPGLRAELTGRQVSGDTRYDGCFSAGLSHDCESAYDQAAARVALQYEGEASGHSLAWSNTRTRRQDTVRGSRSFDSHGTLERLEYLGNLQGFEDFDLVFGADWEVAGSTGRQRHNHGYFLEYLSDFSRRITINAGVRHDRNDDFGEHTSYRVSGAYLLAPIAAGLLKFKASYGTGFRAPSPYEVTYNQGPFATAPAAGLPLQQETSRGYEFGLEYQGRRLRLLEIVWFDQQVEDAIYFDLASFSGYLQDEGRGSSRGLELASRLDLTERLQLNANFTFNDTARPNGQPRLRRPRQTANFGVSWYTASKRLNLHAFWRASRNSIDEVFGESVPLEDFDVLDLHFRYALSDQLEIYARMENVLDERYQEVADYQSPGRAGYLGFRLNWSAP